MLNNTSIQLCIRKQKAKSTCKRINIASPGWSSFLLSLNRIILCRRGHVGNPLLSLENEQTPSDEISMQVKKQIQTGFSRKIKTLASSISKSGLLQGGESYKFLCRICLENLWSFLLCHCNQSTTTTTTKLPAYITHSSKKKSISKLLLNLTHSSKKRKEKKRKSISKLFVKSLVVRNKLT